MTISYFGKLRTGSLSSISVTKRMYITPRYLVIATYTRFTDYFMRLRTYFGNDLLNDSQELMTT